MLRKYIKNLLIVGLTPLEIKKELSKEVYAIKATSEMERVNTRDLLWAIVNDVVAELEDVDTDAANNI